MCLTINLFSQVLDELQKEHPSRDPQPQAFYKCGRSNKHDVYCPITPRRQHGSTTLHPSRQEKQISSL
jgi:hypothetical protein